MERHTFSSQANLEIAAKMMGVTKEALAKALVEKSIKTVEGVIMSQQKVSGASDVRDALCRQIYGLQFNEMVAVANAAIGFKPNISLFCGVLDIFGFECFKVDPTPATHAILAGRNRAVKGCDLGFPASGCDLVTAG